MLASPAHISRLTTILVVVGFSAALGLADIVPLDCDKDDAICSLHDAIPSTGKTLLQRNAWSPPSSPNKKKAHQAQKDVAASPEGLPPGAKEFFEEKLCKGLSAAEGRRKQKGIPTQSLVTKTASTPNFESQDDEQEDMKDVKTAKGEVTFDGDDHEAPEGKPNISQEEVSEEEASRQEEEFRARRMSYDESSHGQHREPSHEEDDIIINAFFTEGDAFVERDSALLKLHSKTPIVPWILLQRPSDTKSKPKTVNPSSEVAAPDEFSKLVLADLDDGLDAPLNEIGFQKVRSLHSVLEMKYFIGRMAVACDMKVIDEGGLNGAATFLVDFDYPDVTLDNLKGALFQALMAASRDHWATVNVKDDVTGSSAPLDVFGFVQVRALRNATESITFVTRMIDHLGIKITDQGGFEGLMLSYSEPDDSESFQSLMTKIKMGVKQHTWAEIK